MIEWNSIAFTDSLFRKIKKLVKYSYRFDDNGHEIEEDWHSPYDNIFRRSKKYVKFSYRYDENNYEVEHISYNSEEIISEMHLSTYNEQGRRLKEDWQKAEGDGYTKTGIEYHDYDTNGNWLTRFTFHENKTVEITERTLEYYR